MSTQTSEAKAGRGASTAWLWASAFVLAGLIVMQLGRADHRAPDAALAMPMMGMGDVSRIGDYTVLTFNGGSDDVLAVLDSRGEELFLYRVRNMNQFEFVGREDLATFFAAAKRLGPGKK